MSLYLCTCTLISDATADGEARSFVFHLYKYPERHSSSDRGWECQEHLCASRGQSCQWSGRTVGTSQRNYVKDVCPAITDHCHCQRQQYRLPGLLVSASSLRAHHTTTAWNSCAARPPALLGRITRAAHSGPSLSDSGRSLHATVLLAFARRRSPGRANRYAGA